MRISKKDAVKYLLWHQNLARPRSLKESEIWGFIKRVGCIQFDPLNTVGYNPNLVLQSRVKNYKSNMLYKLLYEDKLLIDGWDKCMSIYSRDEWSYLSRVRETTYVNSAKYNNPEVSNAVNKVKETIIKQGPICSSDLEITEKIDWFWGNAKLARAVLEYLFYKGEIIVHHKVGTRKYYDLVENEINEDSLKPYNFKDVEKYNEWYVNRRVNSIGLLWNKAGDTWLGIKNLKSDNRNKAFKSLTEQKKLSRIEIEGFKYDLYMPTEGFVKLNEIISNFPRQKKVSFIAPLDNFIWERKLIKELFNFQYTWEVYTPSSKRQYGYYVLPVLYGDKFVARFEPRFNKKTKQLHILNWWWEKNIRITKSLTNAITTALNDFSKYLGATEIIGKDCITKS